MSGKMFNPAAARNCDPILQVLLNELRPDATVKDPALTAMFPGFDGAVLEVSSGSGQHVVHFAPRFPKLLFYPSEVAKRNFQSIREYTEEAGLPNIKDPVCVDASLPSREWAGGIFPRGSLSAIINVNMMHITPFKCTQGLFKGAGELLSPNGRLLTYGPYAYNGVISPESNVQFDRSLRSQDSSWGLRDVHRELEPLAGQAGLKLSHIHKLPANNQLLVWDRVSKTSSQS